MPGDARVTSSRSSAFPPAPARKGAAVAKGCKSLPCVGNALAMCWQYIGNTLAQAGLEVMIGQRHSQCAAGQEQSSASSRQGGIRHPVSAATTST